ncbi:crotonase/enoyl-CoA hydratase family protein [Coralloluteibacterium stylophorae]|uniref:Enoyl-CoA hydratase/isomerase family protein n=2 Tax=Coralloluteibacterium stylophorae TaxID=1776034 RepID=A0AAP2C8Z2_9GAMM|nr:crotonase/enoyl-CoA hydratase family protein [Coralloluteibacterium stylophorae]MBS7455919.1 enoyl-CoA hydratase/isomerase family protein [Coralloluteibacterium stylophorae]
MNNVKLLHRESAYSTIRIQEESDNDAYWCFMHAHAAAAQADYRPCFNRPLMHEMHAYLRHASDRIALRAATGEHAIAHVVVASDAPVFNLGGDLDLFGRYIRARDRDGLLTYARDCVEGVYALHGRLHPTAHSIALVEGDALGGGFELALSCQTIVAESGVSMGFPEVLFGLFPGMGAFSYLRQRVSAKLAEEMMLNGTMYTSDELHRMGIVDVLVGKGEGVRAVEERILRNRRIASARLALDEVRRTTEPVSLDELMRITGIWVDAALRLGDRSLRTMERLVRAQLRRPGGPGTGSETLSAPAG